VLDEYSVTITGYYPPDGDFSECLQTPDFEVAIAKTILHELIHITDPELADGSQWIEPNTVSTSDPNYFGHPREQRAFLGEFHAAIRVLSRHLGAANTDPRALREVVRLSVMANTTSTFRRWMEGAGRLDIYEDALDRALDANPRFRVGGP
jgi:hypothetical protein